MYLSVFFVFFNLKTTCFLIEKKLLSKILNMRKSIVMMFLC